jgi:hypothetical protein
VTPARFDSQSQHRCAPVALRINSQSHHFTSHQGIVNNTDNQQRTQSEATLRMRGRRPMGRSSKDTMESPYSARLPSSLSWRQNREDASSSGNGRWAAPVFFATTSELGSRYSLFPPLTATQTPPVWARRRKHLQNNPTAVKWRLRGCHAL